MAHFMTRQKRRRFQMNLTAMWYLVRFDVAIWQPHRLIKDYDLITVMLLLAGLYHDDDDF